MHTIAIHIYNHYGELETNKAIHAAPRAACIKKAYRFLDGCFIGKEDVTEKEKVSPAYEIWEVK